MTRQARLWFLYIEYTPTGGVTAVGQAHRLKAAGGASSRFSAIMACRFSGDSWGSAVSDLASVLGTKNGFFLKSYPKTFTRSIRINYQEQKFTRGVPANTRFWIGQRIGPREASSKAPERGWRASNSISQSIP